MSSEQEETSDALQDPLSIEEIVPSDNLIGPLEEVLKTENEDKDPEDNENNVEQDNAENSDEVQNIENITNENKADQVTPKPNRELKSILELSKEANLDTNIVHKRKSVEPIGKQQEKGEAINKRRNSSSSSSDNQKVDKKLKVQDSSEKSRNVRDTESPSSISDSEEGSETKEKDESKINNKRKRSSLPDSNIGGAFNEHGKRNRKLSTNLIITMNNKVNILL